MKTRLLAAIAAVAILIGLSATIVQGSQKGNAMSNTTHNTVGTESATAQATTTANDLEANKALVQQVVEVLNTGNYEILNKIVAEDYVQHGAGRPSTRKGLQATYAAYRAAFPDIKWTIEFIGADGDKVFIYTSLSGTQKAPFNGIPATNKKVTINTADVFLVKDGMLAAHWDVYDQFGLLTQLGVLPAQK